MLDIALLSTNASQLKYILTVGEEHEYYLPMLVLIISSIVLQVNNFVWLSSNQRTNVQAVYKYPILEVVSYQI